MFALLLVCGILLAQAQGKKIRIKIKNHRDQVHVSDISLRRQMKTFADLIKQSQMCLLQSFGLSTYVSNCAQIYTNRQILHLKVRSQYELKYFLLDDLRCSSLLAIIFHNLRKQNILTRFFKSYGTFHFYNIINICYTLSLR